MSLGLPSMPWQVGHEPVVANGGRTNGLLRAGKSLPRYLGRAWPCPTTKLPVTTKLTNYRQAG
jgi:hypothetical protein